MEKHSKAPFEIMQVDRYNCCISVRWNRRVYATIQVDPKRNYTREEFIEMVEEQKPDIIYHDTPIMAIAEDIQREQRILRDRLRNDAIGDEFLEAIMNKLKH